MTVLGVHFGHDSSCTIIKDGHIIADAQEERFTRIKHTSDAPRHALAYCLSMANISDINDIDLICSHTPSSNPFFAALFGLQQDFPSQGQARSKLKTPVYMPDYRIRNAQKLIRIEHHLAHAASAHYTRATGDKCLVFTMDGIGDGVCCAVWQAEGSKILPLQKLGRAAAIGWAYSLVTEALDWWHGDGEGKTMGLAPYGISNACQGVLDEFFPQIKGCDVYRPSGLGEVYSWSESNAIHFHFEEAYKVKALCEKYGRENVAAEAQRKLEECVLEYVYSWVQRTGIRRTAFAGGVFLNVKLNQRLWNLRHDNVIEQHIFPNPGDSGLSIGCALHGFYRSHDFAGMSLDTLSWGPQYDDSHVEQLLRQRQLSYIAIDDPSRKAAELLASGLIVGWFQGRMESGPRALGNRSILMSPQPAENKDVINHRVKFRESFRPFCPSILWTKGADYLLDARDENFMITSFDVNPSFRDRLAAVVHVDGTVRPQLVKRESNEQYWRLINEFGRRTGIYAILNTSMNIKGEPIVNTPNEAIRLFFDSGLDALFIGRLLLTKRPQ